MKRNAVLLSTGALVLVALLALPTLASAGCEPNPIPGHPFCQICTDNPDTGCCVQVGECGCRDQICFAPLNRAAQSDSAGASDWWTSVVAPVLAAQAPSPAASPAL